MEHISVFIDEKRYCSFPFIVHLQGNELLVAFREAGTMSVQAGQRNQPTHHDRDSKVVIIRSHDGGKTWDASSRVEVRLPEFGINDPALTRLKSGELILRFSGMEVRPSSERNRLSGPLLAHRVDLQTVSGVQGNFISRSLDQGLTWSAPQRIEAGELTCTLSREPVLELADGTWLLSVYSSHPTRAETSWMIRSWDQGKTWSDASLIAEDRAGSNSAYQGANFNETAVIAVGPNRLFAMIRADGSYYTEGQHMPIGGVGELLFSFSDNTGLSWNKPAPSGIWGQPAHLLTLPDGRILCTYGIRKAPYSVAACVSSDSGAHWTQEKPILIRSHCPSWDMGYPSSACLPDGTIVSVYYWINSSGIRYIEATRWRLK